jgi:hypothetical protein
MLKYGIPEVALAFVRTTMLPDIIKQLGESIDATVLNSCLIILWELLSISTIIEESIKDSSIKDYISKYDAPTVLNRLTVNNLIPEIHQLAEGILIRFYNVEQIS